MKTYDITALVGEAYKQAVFNVLQELRFYLEVNLNFYDDKKIVASIANNLGVRFDCDGNIVKNG